MNRVLSSLMAAVFSVATMAAPVLTHPKFARKSVSKPSKYKLSSAKGKASRVQPKPYEIGIASWYGKQFQGRTTASGEDFDMFELTAAHRRLPLGTYVKVTNLRNSRWVIVRINDRGPYVAGRIMDLSYGSARMLGFRGGMERVRLDVLRPETVAVAKAW